MEVNLIVAVTDRAWFDHLRALPLVFASFLIKSHQEEAHMRATFPDYERHAKRMPALVPLLF